MCQFLDVQVQGGLEDTAGNLLDINLIGRISTNCNGVEATVTDGFGNQLFLGSAQLSNTTNVVNGVQVRVFSVQINTAGRQITCDDRVTVTVNCTADATCTFTDTIPIDCKEPSPDVCPDSSVLSIAVSQNGNPVDLSANCTTAGTFEAQLNGVPAASTISWFVQIGMIPTAQGGANPISFAAPVGNETVTIMAVVTPPGNCPDIVASVTLPPREQGNCPAAVTTEIRRNGTIVTTATDLAAGDYLIRALTPSGAGISYTFTVNGVITQTGASPDFLLSLPGNSTTRTVIVTASGVPCCPPVSTVITLTSATGDPVDPLVPADPTGPADPGGDPDGTGGDDGGGGFSLCGFLYAVMMALVFAFIGLWIFSFATFPVSGAVWIALGVAFALVLGAMLLYGAVCGLSTCRRWRIFAWMFAWCTIGCLIGFALSAFTVWALMIGALIAGIIAFIIGLIMANQNCDFLTLFELP